MKRKPILISSLVALLLLIALAGYSAMPTTVEQVPRLTKEAVKEMLGKPDVVIVDIRYIKQYEQSDKKLPGGGVRQPRELRRVRQEPPAEGQDLHPLLSLTPGVHGRPGGG